MQRRQFLALAGGALPLAGCLGGSAQPTGPTDTATPSPSPTPTTTDDHGCPVAPDDTAVEVPAWPDRPDSFTRERALAYATEFEVAYVTRKTLAGRERIVSISVNPQPEDTEVARTDDGWLVRFWVVGPAYRYYPDANSTETMHADPPAYLANYLLTGEAVFRAVATEAVAPRGAGAVVPCPP